MFSTVHPRECGEHGGQHVRHGQIERFIPASAGNTETSDFCSCTDSVHPRECGEHSRSSRNLRNRAGSSPRVRGTRRRAWPAQDRRRFIPASAGNTHNASAKPTAWSVHPRECGEHLRIRADRQQRERFIPASAGNTPKPTSTTCSIPVHPRECGEHSVLRV